MESLGIYTTLMEMVRVLNRIEKILQEMKQQEHDYWETWKKSKEPYE